MTSLFLALGIVAAALGLMVLVMAIFGVLIGFGTRGLGDEGPEPMVASPHRPMWQAPRDKDAA